MNRSEEKHSYFVANGRRLHKQAIERIAGEYPDAYGKIPIADVLRSTRRIGVLIYDLPNNQIIVSYDGTVHHDGHDVVAYFDANWKLRHCHFDG